jgi:iron(III) transport system permease protein
VWNRKFRFPQAVVVTTIVGLAVAPMVPLGVVGLTAESAAPLWNRAFLGALGGSLLLAVAVAVLSLVAGFPLGLLSGLYRFPARRPLLLLQVLPLLLPSFLLAIGWSSLVNLCWFPPALIPAGLWGTAFVLGLQGMPLPFFTTLAACRNLTATQIDAARLHGGEWTVLGQSARSCFRPAVLAALLAGILSLSDPGAALILGGQVVAVEILTSFSSLFDFALAAKQCLLLAGLVLLLVLPWLLTGLRTLAVAVLARQTRAPVLQGHHPLGRLTGTGLLTVLAVGLGVPAFGLCLPALNNPMFSRAWEEIRRTFSQMVIYSGGAAVVAVLLATALALSLTGYPRLRLLVVGLLLGLFAMPPAMAALGVVQTATRGPPALDWLTRSRLTVVLVLGLRFLPVATVVMLRGTGSLSPSWGDAARLHGVPWGRFLARVVLPMLRPALLAGLVMVMVLATADITTVLLLHPPGRMSLPVAIFTVMANSPEGLVASLCLLYLGGAVLVMAAATVLVRIRPGRSGPDRSRQDTPWITQTS